MLPFSIIIVGTVDLLYDFVDIFTTAILGIIAMQSAWINVITTSIVLGLIWYMTYFLYKRKIFISGHLIIITAMHNDFTVPRNSDYFQ